MPLPDSSILVTPGTTATVATEVVAGKHYQVDILADAYGHLIGGRDTYVASDVDVVKAASKRYLSVFNDSTSTTIEVTRAIVSTSTSAAVTGLTRSYRLWRITAQSGGSIVTPQKLKTSSATPSAPRIRCRQRLTAATTTGVALGFATVYEEETGGGEEQCVLFDEREVGEPIILVQGEGVMIQQDSQAAGTGLLSSAIYFRLR
jgi:hypothetical protein